jgi:phage protein
MARRENYMKIGVRKPSLSKSLKARTTSKWKRQMKKAVIPTYGQKGTGIIKNPKRALYNKVYNKTTVDAFGSMKKSQSKKQEQAIYTQKGRKIHPASSWYFPVGLLAFCTLLYFTINLAIGFFLLILTIFMYIVNIKNNPFKTKKDIQDALNELQEHEE